MQRDGFGTITGTELAFVIAFLRKPLAATPPPSIMPETECSLAAFMVLWTRQSVIACWKAAAYSCTSVVVGGLSAFCGENPSDSA